MEILRLFSKLSSYLAINLIIYILASTSHALADAYYICSEGGEEFNSSIISKANIHENRLLRAQELPTFPIIYLAIGPNQLHAPLCFDILPDIVKADILTERNLLRIDMVPLITSKTKSYEISPAIINSKKTYGFGDVYILAVKEGYQGRSDQSSILSEINEIID